MLMMPIRPKVIARPSAASRSTLPSESPLKTLPTTSSRPSRDSIARRLVAISARTSASGSLKLPSGFFSSMVLSTSLMSRAVAPGEALDRREPRLGVGILELQRRRGDDEELLDLVVGLLAPPP